MPILYGPHVLLTPHFICTKEARPNKMNRPHLKKDADGPFLIERRKRDYKKLFDKFSLTRILRLSKPPWGIKAQQKARVFFYG
jgi:hypothetical protein